MTGRKREVMYDAELNLKAFKDLSELKNNLQELLDAIKEFDADCETVGEKYNQKNWEYFDVIIRCFVLSSCINDALEEIKDEFKKAHTNRN